MLQAVLQARAQRRINPNLAPTSLSARKCDVQAALAFLARRHESLRTRFPDRDGEMLQAVLPPDDPAAAPRVRRWNAQVAEGDLLAHISRLADKPYQLVGAGVPLRACLVDVAPGGQSALLIGMHHILRCALRRRG